MALSIIAALGLANIVLTLLVIRRLGEHSRLLAENASARPASAAGWPAAIDVAPGEQVGDFAVTAFDGTPVSRGDLNGRTLVGFVAPGCPACDASLPDFIERAGAAEGGRDQVVAVVMGDARAAGEVCEQLAPVARVLTEDQEAGPLATAFGVGGLPAFALLAGDTVVASHSLIERLPA